MNQNTFLTSILTARTQGSGITDYWLGREDQPILRKFSTFMNEPRFTAGQLPISYRVLNHWANLDILPDGVSNNGSWRKFTFVERVWIGVVVHLRDFGLPLNKIAEAKKHILKYDKKCKGYALFEYYISLAIASSDDPYVLMITNGIADVGTQQEIEIYKQSEGSKDMILISLKAVLESLGEKVKNPKSLLGLSEDETKIIEAIRIGGDDELNIKLGDGAISETQRIKTQHGKSQINDILKELKENKTYADITIKMQNGIPEMVKVVKKQRSRHKSSE
jgi:DNA-binding transcriptional MerR regulator